MKEIKACVRAQRRCPASPAGGCLRDSRGTRLAVKTLETNLWKQMHER